MVVLDPVFEGVGQEPGIKIWRVEKLELKPIPSSSYGTFYAGDSYVLLHTKKMRSGRFDYNIHFWLGKDTSQDEKGVAAIKSVELDDVLGGSPVQHREVQGHESKQFLSYFKNGIRYLDGGVASGFHHVEDQVVKRLLQVKGRRNVRIHQVPLSIDSMNKGDCFILDAGPNIYIWVGDASGRMERFKAIQAANGIRDDIHGGRSTIRIIEWNSDEQHKFFEELGSTGDIKDAQDGGDDSQYENSVDSEVSLHRISDEGGSLKVEKVSGKPLKQEYLETSDCFILDGGIGCLFVWVGKKASHQERVESMKLAERYLDHRKYPKWCSVSRVIDGGEPPMFKQFFSSWKEPEDQVGLGRIHTLEKIAATSNLDVNALHSEKRRHLARSLGKACGFMPDDGSGSVEIWRIENFELAPTDPSTYGMFFGGDSYIIKYTSRDTGKCIIYYWQGSSSSQDEKAAAAIWAVKKDNEMNGKAIQIRVAQGSEPEHFLRIFKGKLINLSGGHASGFRNLRDHDTYDVDGTRMFHIQGTNEFNVRAVQVPEVAVSLCSEDVFILETPSTTYVWIGKGANDDEKNMAKNIAPSVSPDRVAVIVEEGEENDNFWNSIGGKGNYSTSKGLHEKPLLEPRLFKCSETGGKFRVEEICNFDQGDLSEDDVMILDTGDEVFIWIGEGSSDEEKSQSLKLAEGYIGRDPTDRTVDTSVIITIKQGREPESFTEMFDNWNPNFWNELQSYEELKKAITESNSAL